MRVVLLLTVTIVIGHETTTSPVAANGDDTSFCPHDNHSLLTNMLTMAGYNDTCVASALDSCARGDTCHLKAFVEEARKVVQDVRTMVQEVRERVQTEIPLMVQNVGEAFDEAVLSTVRDAVHVWESRPRHCQDLRERGDNGSGVRHVYPHPARPNQRVAVLCDNTLDGGGWTVFQRRVNDSLRLPFNRTWLEYQLGFGDLEGEFWLGLDLLHVMTSSSLQQLRIDLHDYEGEHKWAKYDLFHVGDADTKYRLSVSRYNGDAGDGMKYHDGQKFSTYDNDNDATSSNNCALKYQGAWWYKSCHTSNLNGYQYQGLYSKSGADGITWKFWKGNTYSLRKTTMMLRPAF